MSDISYTPATADDIDLLIDYRIALFRELFEEVREDSIIELRKSLKDYFLNALSKTYFGWIARSGDEIAGVGGFYIKVQPGTPKNPSGRIAYIMGMYTTTAFRRQGVCTAILDCITDQATDLGLTMFELHATEAGAAVYVQKGFRKHTEPTYRLYL